ncbi:MAG: response regulator [Nanoarchaeota archaeon]|nr:response regulator [Nanoarchaeota archaeon]
MALRIPNVLIVEDQAPLETLRDAVEEVFPKHYSGFTSSNYAVAECYNEAQGLISQNAYDIVILDHRMPMENQSHLQRKDFKAFCETLRDVGYSLIPEIKQRNPNAVVIGTSSLSRDELRRYSAPDFKLDKVTMQVSEDLEKIVAQVKERSEKGGKL